jgi:hypothetical protein
VTTQVTGRLGGQYSLSITDDQKYRVQGQTPQTSGVHTLYKGDYEVATRLLDFCQQHDGLAQEAIWQLFFNGDPTAMLDLIEHAKNDPSVRGRRRVALYINLETDVLEDEDAITVTNQKVSAALRMCGVTVRSLESGYIGQVQPEVPVVGLAYCFEMVEKALISRVDDEESAKEIESTMKKLRRQAGFIQPEAFDIEEGTGNGQPA